jgi:hypothetical protein
MTDHAFVPCDHEPGNCLFLPGICHHRGAEVDGYAPLDCFQRHEPLTPEILAAQMWAAQFKDRA